MPMKPRILIIEDNPANMELMSYLLEAHGYTVVPAVDGEAGLAAVQAHPFELILCDILLPKMDGYQVAQNLKRDARFARVPLVAVTALAMAGDSEKVMKGGFDGYISKPIEPTKFVPQVEVFLTRRGAGVPAAASDDSGPSLAASPERTPTLAHKGKVLVVDDSRVNADLLRATLEPSGYAITICGSAKEGLALARLERFDLILSDLHMPHLDGLELARIVRADSSLAGLAFIVISASEMTDREQAEIRAAGADDCIARPIEPERILERVAAVLSRRS